MFLLKSTFWLAVAYFALAPQFDMSRSVADVSSQALNAGKQLVSERVDATQCSTLDCVGAKLVITASLNSLSQDLNSQEGVAHGAAAPIDLLVPVPLPRLSRPG